MKNDVNTEGMQRLTLIAPVGGVTGGLLTYIGQFVGIPVSTELEGETFTLQTKHVVSYAKVAAEAFLQGAAVYYDAADDKMTSDADGGTNKLVGYAVFAAAANSALVEVRLNETKGA